MSYICNEYRNFSGAKEIRIVHSTPQFDAFFEKLPPQVQNKFLYAINVISRIYSIPTKFVKHLVNTDLYEFRVSVGYNEYRTILFAIDHHNVIECTQIILLNGFIKKSSKDYLKQIALAKQLLKNLEQ